MARPNKSEAEKKRSLVQLRITQSEKSTLQDFAKTAGMNVTDFVKAKTLGKAPKTKMATHDRQVFIQFLAELAKIGSNINQIAKVMNISQKPFYSVKVKEVIIVEVMEKLKTLSSVILDELYHVQKKEVQNSDITNEIFPRWSPAEK